MFRDKLIRDVFKMVLILLGIIVACRLTKGIAGGALVLLACYWALTGKSWSALACFVVSSFIILLNGAILPKSGYLGLFVRVGSALMAMAFLIGAAQSRGLHKLPLGGLILFLIVAFISSMNGYMPLISYFKLLNFLLFLLCVWIGTRNIRSDGVSLYRLRCFLLAISALLIYGSLLTLPFPGIAYPQNVSALMTYGNMSASDAAAVVGEMRERSYFAGILGHSNTLAPIMSCCVGYLMCDLFFVEQKMTKFHAASILIALPLLYFTRSRGAFVTTMSAVMVIFVYGTSVIPTPFKVKAKARNAIIALFLAGFIGALFLEFNDHSFSKYLRKTEDVSSDQRSLGEAMTQSRMGLIDMNLYDFRRNPAFGSGFQTVAAHKELYQMGMISIFSAPIEKGVLPLMVLGETGLVGAMVFYSWVIAFLAICHRKKYICTVCLFCAFMATNLGEASFFSPGGVGGMLWMMTIVGGFVCDLQIISRRRQQMQMRRW